MSLILLILLVIDDVIVVKHSLPRNQIRNVKYLLHSFKYVFYTVHLLHMYVDVALSSVAESS